MTSPRYGNGGAKGTRQVDDTPLSDGFIAKGASVEAIARLRGTGRNPFPSFQQGPGAEKLGNSLRRQGKTALANRANKLQVATSDRAHFNNPNRFGNEFQPKQSNFSASGVGKAEVSKTRHYDPEHRRQQRLGAATALLAVGGGVAAAHGVRGIIGTTKAAREITGVSTKVTGNDAQKTVKNARLRNAMRSGVHANLKDLAYTGGGIAGIGGAGAVQGHANSRRGKAWD